MENSGVAEPQNIRDLFNESVAEGEQPLALGCFVAPLTTRIIPLHSFTGCTSEATGNCSLASHLICMLRPGVPHCMASCTGWWAVAMPSSIAAHMPERPLRHDTLAGCRGSCRVYMQPALEGPADSRGVAVRAGI